MNASPPEQILENLAALAKAGGKDALEELVSGIHQEAVGIRETGNSACPLIEPS